MRARIVGVSAGLSEASWGALRVFVAVYRAGSITAAATELDMAQSSVSGQLKALEKHVGCLLFERTRAGVVATDRGRELAALLRGPVDALAAATATVGGSEHPVERPILLGGPAEFLSEVVLPKLVGDLPARIRLSVRFGIADTLIEALKTGQVDVLISPVQPRRPGLVFEPVHDEQFVLVGHSRWTKQANDDLDSVPVLAYDAELQIVRRYWRSVFERRPTRLRAAALIPDLRVLARLAAQGLGMTVLPEYLARPLIDRGELTILHNPEIPPLNTLYVATRAAVASDPVIAALRAQIVALCRALAE